MYGCRTEQQESVDRMADTLRREGWRLLFDLDDIRCYWRHESGLSVNNAGGYFRCAEEATWRAYKSQVRTILMQRED